MKTILTILLGALLLLPALARAGEVYLLSGGAEPLATNASCTVTVNTSGTAGSHTYLTRDCDPDADEGVVWHFQYPADAPTTGTPFTVYVGWQMGGTDTGYALFNVDLACSPIGTDWDSPSFGTATTVTSFGTGVADIFKATSGAAAIAPTTMGVNMPCVARVVRDADNASDTLTDDAKLMYLRINY